MAGVMVILLLIACDKEGVQEEIPSIDRGALLESWADNIIIPRTQSYQASLEVLSEAVSDFMSETTTESLSELRNAWKESYRQWQRVSIFEIGKAEELNRRNFTNIYPTDIEAIAVNVDKIDIDLTLPSTFDEQGFPAIEYILYGLASEEELLSVLKSEDKKWINHLAILVDRLNTISEDVLIDWEQEYRDLFIANDGSSANASVDLLINDLVLYFEKFLRAGKVGIPAGVFSSTPLPQNAEAIYNDDFSRDLFLESLESVSDFFNGINESTGVDEMGIDNYLDKIDELNGNSLLSELINGILTSAADHAITLNQSFRNQVESDNEEMLKLYDLLQQGVIYFKTDMLQALNIAVDYVDADGD